MKQCIKAELWKALHNPMFYAALIIGCLLSLLNLAENYYYTLEIRRTILAEDFVGNRSPWGFSLFLLWMPVNGISYAKTLFYMVWPILAAMPFGWSYLQERRSGLYNQVVTRVSRRSYFVSKYIAVFVSGGLAVGGPVLFNLLTNAMICPYELPHIVNMVQIADGYFASQLYFTAPWLYALLWCGVSFLLGGAAAGLCFVVGTWLRLQVMTILTPFALLWLAEAATSSIPRQVNKYNLELSPLRLAMAIPIGANPEWLVMGLFLVLALVGFGVGYWQVTQHELA